MSALQMSFSPALCAALVVATAALARAFEPVPRVIEGCVRNGVFTSTDSYVIRPQRRMGEPFDLSAFEGRSATLDGDLLPGDLMILKAPPQDKEPCAKR